MSSCLLVPASEERGLRCVFMRLCVLHMCENRMLEKRQKGTEKPTQSGHRHPDEIQTHTLRQVQTHTLMLRQTYTHEVMTC